MEQSFLNYLRYEKRFSPHTVRAYETDLYQLKQFLVAQFDGLALEQANHATLRSWIIDLVDGGTQPRSVNRKLATLRTFYKYLLKHEHIKQDPTLNLSALKTPKALPHFVQENEMVRLLDDLTFAPDFEGWRDKAILELLYGTGIRLSELIGLTHRGVHATEGVIKVLGKRNKERVIPVSSQVLLTLKSYLKYKTEQFGTGNDVDYLFVTNSGRQCYPSLVYRTVKKYLRMVSTVDKQSPHVLRHTYATHLLNKGADLNAVKELLGHTSLAATQVYTHNSLEKLKEVFNQAHPKA